MASTGKIVEVLLGSAVETYEAQEMMLDKVDRDTPNPAMLQNAGNVYYETIQQHAPILEGWDLNGQEQNIIEETVPLQLGTPKNDFVQQRADDLRDMRFWERRGIASGRQQATELNKAIAQNIALNGSLFYSSNATSGFDFIAEGQAIMNERQGYNSGRCFMLNDRSTLKYAKDLAGRQTVQGRPEETWGTGQLANNVAEFDVYTGSFLPSLAGGADPATTVTGNQSFKPEGGTVAGQVVTNVDYRLATIPVAASGSYNIGDKVEIRNGGTAIKSIGLADKGETGQNMTFTVVGKPSGTSLQIFPKPIALDDVTLSATEKAYANVNTTITNTATVNRLNTNASFKTNLFWDKDAVKVITGEIPAQLMNQFAGFKVVPATMKNGQVMYAVYDGNIENMTFRYRLFTWYGVNMIDPSRAGVAQSV